VGSSYFLAQKWFFADDGPPGIRPMTPKSPAAKNHRALKVLILGKFFFFDFLKEIS
jgi:hypothetical protein